MMGDVLWFFLGAASMGILWFFFSKNQSAHDYEQGYLDACKIIFENAIAKTLKEKGENDET